MAKFRTYKNGINGHRYKKYYIIRNHRQNTKKDKLYGVIDEKGELLFKDSPSFEDCEWFIDKLTATEEEMKLYHTLYDCDIAKLHRMAAKYSGKTEDGTIQDDEKILYNLIMKIIGRKIKDFDF